MLPRPLIRLAVATPFALLLAACDISGIGDGNALEKVEILRSTAPVDPTSGTLYRCLPSQLQLIGTFSNGQRGDYTLRGRWSSSNPDRVAVSNGDIQLPSDPTLAYAAGTVLPKAQGSATITAEFVGLVATYQVDVKSPTSFTISPASLTVAPRTARAIGLRAVLDGYDVDVSSAAEWSFDTPDEKVALIGANTGIVAGVGSGALTARAKFPLCEGFAPAQNLAATINVRVPTSLVLTREFTQAPNNELIVNTTDAFQTIAHFAGTDETQDISSVLTYVSDKPTVALTGASGVRNFATALGVGTAVFTAKYQEKLDDPATPDVNEGSAEIVSNPVTITVVEDALDTIAVTPEVATITALGTQQFVATGNYTSGRTQPITRHVTWSSADVTKVLIRSGISGAGLAVSLLPQATEAAVELKASVTIGSGTAAVSKTDTALICTVLPGQTPGTCEAAPATP